MDVELADHIPDGWKLWQTWVEICYEQFGKDYAQREAEMLRADAGRNLGFTRLVARRK